MLNLTFQAGCVPVIMSNGWQLPFGEVIDWPAASITIDERLLLQATELLRTVPQPQVLNNHSFCLFFII